MFRSGKRLRDFFAAIGLLLLMRNLLSAEPAQPGVQAYTKGLQALQQGKPAEAIDALSEAVDADEENADFYTARGVARVLAEKLPEAAKDLERSLRLRPGHHETRMWLASGVAMGGEFDRDVTIYPVSTDDRHESFVRQASHDYGQLPFRRNIGGDITDAPQLRVAARQKLAQGAAEFVTLAKGAGGAAVTSAVTGQAKELYKNGDYAAALAEFAHALAADDDDAESLYYHANCALALDDYTTAREEFTRLLTVRTDDGPGYLGRALAAAKLGDAERAKNDLARAARLKAADLVKVRQQVHAALTDLPSDPQPTKELFDALFAAAKKASDPASLVEQALALRRVVHGRQRRYDEWYQDELRKREDAVRTEPLNADRLADLGKFLYDESSVHRERVEPRAPYRLFRYQTKVTQNRELARAEKLANEALALNPRQVRAIAVKASVRMWNGLYGDAQEIVRLGLKVDPNSDELLERMAEVLEVAAAQKSGEARDLRTPQYLSSRQETVGDYLYTYTYYHHPSLQEKQRAAELDSEAQRCIDMALDQIQKAARRKQGTAEGWYYQGVYYWRQQQLPEAQSCYEQALKLAPDRVRWHFNLAGILVAQGKYAAALEARIAGTRLIESSAPLLLELTWDYVAKTRWRTARETLRRAVDLNAADARIPAYMGVVSIGSEKTADARPWFLMALALEEARLRLHGRTLSADGKSSLAAEDYGLSMTLRRRLGDVLLALDQPEEAANICLAAMALEPRVPRENLAAGISSAMIPNPDMDPNVVPEAEHVLVLAAWNRIVAGQALLRLKKIDQAIQTLTPIASFGQLLVNGKGADKLRRSELHAAMHLAKAWMASGNRQQAQHYAQQLPHKRFGIGPSLSPFAELEEEGSRLQKALSGQ